MTAKSYAFRGEARTLRQIAEMTGVNFYTLRSRVSKYGFTPEEAVAHHGGPRAFRKPRLYEFRGQLLSIREIAELAGISEASAYNRRCGDRVLDGDELIDPVQELHPNATALTFHRKTHSIAGWSRLLGIPKDSLYQRLRAGWPLKRALTEPVMQPDQRNVFNRNRRTIRRIVWVIGTGGYQPTSQEAQGTGVGRHEIHSERQNPNGLGFARETSA